MVNCNHSAIYYQTWNDFVITSIPHEQVSIPYNQVWFPSELLAFHIQTNVECYRNNAHCQVHNEGAEKTLEAVAGLSWCLSVYCVSVQDPEHQLSSPTKQEVPNNISPQFRPKWRVPKNSLMRMGVRHHIFHRTLISTWSTSWNIQLSRPKIYNRIKQETARCLPPPGNQLGGNHFRVQSDKIPDSNLDMRRTAKEKTVIVVVYSSCLKDFRNVPMFSIQVNCRLLHIMKGQRMRLNEVLHISDTPVRSLYFGGLADSVGDIGVLDPKSIISMSLIYSISAI